jgi:predicted nucleic acid-binding protein
VNYLLDANACIALINRRSSAAFGNPERVMIGDSEVFLFSLVNHELWYRAGMSSSPQRNALNLREFLTQGFETL